MSEPQRELAWFAANSVLTGANGVSALFALGNGVYWLFATNVIATIWGVYDMRRYLRQVWSTA